MLTGAVLGLMALGVNPLENDGTLHVGSLVVLANLPVHLLAVVVCVRKESIRPPSSALSFRRSPGSAPSALARPQSTWAKRHYSPSKLERAHDADGFDARWGRYGLALGDLVAGRPTEVTAGPANE